MLVTLRSKILTGYLFVVLLLAGIGTYTALSFRSFSNISNRAFERISETDRSALKLYESFIRINEAQIELLGTAPIKGRKILTEEPAIVNTDLSAAEKVIATIPADLSPALRPTFTKLEILWHQYQAQLPEFLKRTGDDPVEARKFYDGVLQPTYKQLIESNDELAVSIKELFDKTKTLASDESTQAVTAVIIITAMAVIIGIFASFLIVRRTIRPLQRLGGSIKQLQAGDLSVRLPIKDADELGEVSFEFNRMAERLERYEKINIDNLLAEKSKSEAIILSLSDPLFLLDNDGRISLANHAAEELLAISEVEMVSKPLLDLFVSVTMKEQLEVLLKGSSADRSEPVEMVLRGSRRFYTISSIVILSPTSTHSTKAVGQLVHFTDITRYEELDRMKNEFLAKVSHEFRTPLTSVIMALDLLNDGKIGILNEEQRDLVLSSRIDADRLAKLIRDLLMITKIDRGIKPLTAIIDVTTVSTTFIHSLERQFEAKGIGIKATVADGLQAAIGKEDLESILQNLLINALNYTPSGGLVECRISGNTAILNIIVSDTGIGIAAENKSRIFERFVQLAPKDFPTPGSIGLGLAIVKEIVERYGGKIDLESELGKGSTFTVTIPTSDISV